MGKWKEDGNINLGTLSLTPWTLRGAEKGYSAELGLLICDRNDNSNSPECIGELCTAIENVTRP